MNALSKWVVDNIYFVSTTCKKQYWLPMKIHTNTIAHATYKINYADATKPLTTERLFVEKTFIFSFRNMRNEKKHLHLPYEKTQWHASARCINTFKDYFTW